MGFVVSRLTSIPADCSSAVTAWPHDVDVGSLPARTRILPSQPSLLATPTRRLASSMSGLMPSTPGSHGEFANGAELGCAAPPYTRWLITSGSTAYDTASRTFLFDVAVF